MSQSLCWGWLAIHKTKFWEGFLGWNHSAVQCLCPERKDDCIEHARWQRQLKWEQAWCSATMYQTVQEASKVTMWKKMKGYR